MNAILGIAITMCMVFGGYVLAGGKFNIIIKALPFEMMMIGGAATGAFFAANDMATVKHTAGDIGTAISGPKWKKQDYQDLLCIDRAARNPESQSRRHRGAHRSAE